MTAIDMFAKERQAWIDQCRAMARRLLATREAITIEDVLQEFPRPKYIHRNTTGQIFKHEDFKASGFTKSRREVSKGRWIMTWKLANPTVPASSRQLQRSRQVEAAG
jgi:hypothetical protein